MRRRIPSHVPYLYYVAGADGCGEQVFSETLRGIRKERRRLQGGGEEERRAPADVQEEVIKRLGVLGWPVAHSRSPAMHNAALAALGMRRLALPAPAGSARSCSRETTRALAGSGFVGANVTIPHKQAALALADSASARRGDRRGEHADARRRRHDSRREHRRAGPDRGDRRAAARARARSCSARAAAPARPCGRCARRARARCRSRTARASAPSSSRASSALARSRARSPPICSSTARRSAWRRRATSWRSSA